MMASLCKYILYKDKYYTVTLLLMMVKDTMLNKENQCYIWSGNKIQKISAAIKTTDVEITYMNFGSQFLVT